MNLNTLLPAYRRFWIFLVILPFILFGSVIAADGPKAEAVTELETCHMQTNCRSCITFSQNCSWCDQNPYNEYRCDLKENHLANGCKNINNPKYQLDFVKNEETADGGASGKAIQMKPQEILLRIRPSETVKVPFEFYLAKDYPVDMYFLMDLSYTMKRYIDQLATVAKDLVSSIRKLTGTLHVGIGSFIDKVLLPYTDTSFQGIQNPCRSASQPFQCMKTYNFKQIMKLTSSITDFTETIDKLNNLTSANLDHPEGGLDAMMQAVVCQDKIGWRSGARRLIIYISDATFHYAGDGKLGGVVIPNDGHCHLKNNMYTKAELQDYPSVGHIAQMLQKNKVTVVFAVAGDAKVTLYKKLAESLEGAYVSKLDSKQYTIADIVKTSYKNISSRVEMVQTAADTNITFFTKCKGDKLIESNKCENIKLGQTVNFTAVITGPACSQDASANFRQITISPVGLNEKLLIKLELICECPCEEQSKVVPKSPLCNGNGTLTCGLCSCDPGYSGKTCECSTQDVTSKLSENCRPDNQSAECSNRGVCECGKCVCNRMSSNLKRTYSGAYCECDDFSCPNFNKMLCGGPTHGVCKCGKCICYPEYTGTNCNCPTSNTTCLTKNGKICNGYGVCECGVCKCNVSSGYKGRTCEDCPSCPNKCSADKECVKCIKMKTNEAENNSSACNKICKHKEVEIVETFENPTEGEQKLCLFEFNDCIIHHQTIKRNGVEIVQIRKAQESDCTKEIDIKMLIALIVGGIFFIGILILVIWKLVVRYYDKREMARFNEDREKAKWTQQSNPIYEPASTTFKNPTHGLET